MNVKIKTRQYVTFSKQLKFDTADIKCFQYLALFIANQIGEHRIPPLSVSARCVGTLPCFHNVYKEEQLYEFPFASLDEETLTNRGRLFKERFFLCQNCFPFKSRRF